MPKIMKHPDRDFYVAYIANPLLGKYKNGRVKRQAVYGKTQEEVKTNIAKLMISIGDNTYLIKNSVTVAEYLLAWVKQYKGELKPYTFDGYKRNIVKHTIPYIGDIKLQKLESFHIKDMYRKLFETPGEKTPNGLAYRSVCFIHRTISKAFKDAVGNKLMSYNPCEGALMRRPREDALQEAAAKNDYVARYFNIKNPSYKINRTLEIEEVISFLKWLKVRNHKLYLPAILTLGLGGLRRGELLAAGWDQLFLEEKRFVVGRSLAHTKESGVVFTMPKSSTSIRVVPVPDSLVPIFKKIRNQQLKMELRLGKGYKSNGLILCKDDGSIITPNSLSLSWKKTTLIFEKETGIKQFTHHGMRSTIATFYKNAGFNDIIASKSLGHSDTKVTKEYYFRPVESELTKAANLLDEKILYEVLL